MGKNCNGIGVSGRTCNNGEGGKKNQGGRERENEESEGERSYE